MIAGMARSSDSRVRNAREPPTRTSASALYLRSCRVCDSPVAVLHQELQDLVFVGTSQIAKPFDHVQRWRRLVRYLQKPRHESPEIRRTPSRQHREQLTGQVHTPELPRALDGSEDITSHLLHITLQQGAFELALEDARAVKCEDLSIQTHD